SRPSPQELQELELLNKALERALKVRRSVQKTPLEAQGDRGGKAATFSPAEIEEEIKVLQDVPFLLSQFVEAEHAEHATLQQEYESLLTLEGLQTITSQCLHKLQRLREAAESHTRLCPDCTGDAGGCSPAYIPPRDAACGRAGLLAAPLLCYSSFQELRDLFALKLQVAMLNQEIAMQKVMMAELLPALESRLPGPALVRDELAE
ncbi:PREDICTED: uncharacterized protein C16orf59 homolog, partial [Tinamus guttatus]|uniref:uncharacterized protein C16orf59 homolog n=1 Tax=Tinamus guttatus TaxID=94827 RepID=UPI00052EAABA